MKKNHVVFLVKYLSKFKYLLVMISILSLLSCGINLLIPHVTKNIFDSGIMVNNTKNIINGSLIMILLNIIKFFIKYYGQILHARSSVRVTTAIKKDLYSHLLRLPMVYFDKNKKGYLLSRVDEANSLSILFSSAIFDFISSSITAIGAFYFILMKSWLLLLISIAFLPFFYIITRISIKKIQTVSAELYEINANARGKLQESIEGIQELKQLNNEDNTFNDLTDQVNTIANKTIIQSKYAAMGNESAGLLLNISQVVIILVIGLLIVENKLSIGDYIALSQYIMFLYAPIQQIAIFGMTIQPGLVALERVNDILNMDVEDKSKGIKIESLEQIEFREISYKYEGQEYNVLNNINFDIKKGDTVVIQGVNGSGKSTIIKILLGLYNDYNGLIKINGINLADLNIASLRDHIGIISQNVILFSGTLLENIKMANPDISPDHLSKLLRIFDDNLFKDIDPSSIVLNEKANNLSGGQRQKVALLRAFAKDPDVLIFDEATSNMDYSSKKIFEKAIQNIFKDKTCIIISHEADIIDIADRIFKLEDGVIIEISNGPSKSFIRLDSAY